MAQPRQWLILAALLALSLTLGVTAYRQPLHYWLDIGGADEPFISNAYARDANPGANSRWLRDGTVITIPGLSDSHPINLNLDYSGAGREDVAAGASVYFTLSVNGKLYPPVPLYPDMREHTWVVGKELLADGRLTIEFHLPSINRGMVIWPFGMQADALFIAPEPDAEQRLADYVELDGRNVGWLVAIVLLAYSFGAGKSRRIELGGLAVSIALAVGLGELLRDNRPLFVVYAASLALGLLIVRLVMSLIGQQQPHPLRWLFLLTLAVGLLLVMADFQSYDDALKYLTSESLLTRGTLRLPAPMTDLTLPYSRYALGHSIANLPFLALALLVQGLNDAPDGIRYFFVILLNPIISGAGVGLLFLCARRLYTSDRVAISLSLIYFFATLALPYAVQSWSEPLLTTLLLLAFYAMLRVFDFRFWILDFRLGRAVWLFICGFALGYLVFTKEEYVIPAAIFVLWWAARRGYGLVRGRVEVGRGLGILVAEGLLLTLPILIFGLLDLAYNALRTGDPLHNGYAPSNIQFDTPLLVGLYALLLSSGRGLLIFAPPVLLCLWGLRGFWRAWRWEAALIGLLFAEALYFYATYHYWAAGAVWGPRFLVPYVPLLMLVAGMALREWPRWQVWQRWGCAALVGIGVVISMLGTLTASFDHWGYGRGDTDYSLWTGQTWFYPTASPLGHAWDLVTHGSIAAQAMFQLSYYHFPAFANQLVPGLLLGLIGVAGLQAARIYHVPTLTDE